MRVERGGRLRAPAPRWLTRVPGGEPGIFPSRNEQACLVSPSAGATRAARGPPGRDSLGSSLPLTWVPRRGHQADPRFAASTSNEARHLLTWTHRDSNPEPPPCRGGALPVAPQAHEPAASRSLGHGPPATTPTVRDGGSKGVSPRPGRRWCRPPVGVFECHPLWSSQRLAECDPALGVPFACAGATGLEPATFGFGDRCSSSCATPLCGCGLNAKRRPFPVREGGVSASCVR